MAKLGLQLSKLDLPLLITVVALVFLGILMIYEASVVVALRDFSDRYFFVKNQLLWAVLGFGALLFFLKFDYHKFIKLAPALLIAGIILLIIVLLPQFTPEVLGARRRFEIGPVTIQPAELIKLIFVAYVAKRLSGHGSRDKRPLALLPFLALVALILGLIILEPDLGTGMIIVGTGVLVYFLSGAPLRYFTFLIPVFLAGGILIALLAPYRLARLTTFVNPTLDPQGQSYHINQILIALGNGGLFGKGLGQSRQKYEYLPEAPTDSIFAIIAEEFGFVGSALLIGLFLYFIYRAFKISTSAPDELGTFLGLGICSWIALQTFLNIGGMVSLLPLTGIPLPFISYGGSALVTTLAAVGILLNISTQETSVRSKRT